MRERILEILMQVGFSLIMSALKRHGLTKDLPISLMTLDATVETPLDRFFVTKPVGQQHPVDFDGGEETHYGG